MYTVRFNPICNQWVLLGEPIPHPILITPALLVGPEAKRHEANVVASQVPHQPFLLHPPVKKHQVDDLVYAPQAPVGEYELLLYRGDRDLSQWTAKNWEEWLLVLLDRICQFQKNPYLHFIALRFHTSAQFTVEGYVRVGDLVATSRPLVGMGTPLDSEILAKIQDKERIFTVHEEDDGVVMIPSAPTHEKELWYLPSQPVACIHDASAAARHAVASSLSLVMGCLLTEYKGSAFVLELHTAMPGNPGEVSWWVQIYQEDRVIDGVFTVHTLPERFVFTMRHLLAHRTAVV